MKQLRRLLALALLAGLAGGQALAQNYPSKPIRIVVAAGAGGAMDRMARLIGAKLNEAWKQPVLVENRGGAGGVVGADVVAKAAPDGYTILITVTNHAVGPNIYRKLPYDALKDFAPITQLASSFLTLVVNAGVPATSVAELVALAKSQPGRLNYASSGVGSSTQLAAELFKLMTGTDIVHVPYKGSGQTNLALVANEVQIEFAALSILPHIKSGKARALAVTSAARPPALPGVPTMQEAGIRDYVLPGWFGLFAPARTSREIVAKLQAEVARILAQPDTRDRMLAMGAEPVGSTPEEFGAMYRASVELFGKIIREARIPLQG